MSLMTRAVSISFIRALRSPEGRVVVSTMSWVGAKRLIMRCNSWDVGAAVAASASRGRRFLMDLTLAWGPGIGIGATTPEWEPACEPAFQPASGRPFSHRAEAGTNAGLQSRTACPTMLDFWAAW